ncbi:MAG: glycoside hydrolase family 99-like domain-containing protein [Bacteroidota bacterium]
MKQSRIHIALMLSMGLITSCCSTSKEKQLAINPDEEITVAAYYFPNYHEDNRNNAFHGKGWTEWELVTEAQPRFPKHHQPNVPAWGYTDEANPVVMAKKIDAAVDHGIDVFLFDWYMYEDGPFLNRAIDNGFLKAKNCKSIDFALMWANHDWVDIHPYRKGNPQKVLYPGKVSPERYEEICDLLIRDYFKKPNYWKIDGKPYFSIYDVQKFIEGFGSLEATRVAMDRLQEKARASGLKGVHWNLVSWGEPILPSEKTPANSAELVSRLGFNSVTSYVWIHHVKLPETKTDYNYVRDVYFTYWDKAKAQFNVPYYPNVTMGWDPTPRCDLNSEWENVGYPFMNTIGNNTPENFQKALQLTKDKLLSKPEGPRIININCWNEWTEGSYLEPDTVNGMKYLEAIRDVYK